MKTHNINKTVQAANHEQQENVKNSRKTLKVLQEAANDKENLVGRPIVNKSIKLAGENEVSDVKTKILVHKSIQTDVISIIAEDLTSEEEPSSDYWRLLAETRGKRLDESLQELDKVQEEVASLKEENRICKEMLDESKHLIEVLQEIIQETDETNTEEVQQTP